MQDKIQQLFGAIPFEALWESEYLWPDPFEAPGTAPRPVLERFLEHPEEFDSDLTEQILGEVESFRAFEEIFGEKEREPSEEALRARKEFFAIAGISESGEDSGGEEREAGNFRLSHFVRSGCVEEVVPWRIYSLRTAYRWWDGERMRAGFNFNPPEVLIVSDRIDREAGSFYRAIPCSSSEVWRKEDMLGSEDFVFRTEKGSEWVLHSWLGYPVSGKDLCGCLGSLSEFESERLKGELIVGRGGVDEEEEPDWLYLERERLAERAETLPSSVDAERERLERELELASAADFIFLNFAEYELEKRAAASADEAVSLLALVPEADLAAKEIAVHRKKKLGMEGEASVESGPLKLEKGGIIEWRLDPPQPEGMEVFVFDLEERRNLGRAELSSDGAVATFVESDWERLRPYFEAPTRLGDLAVVVVVSDG